MDIKEFQKYGKDMVDYIARYYENLHEQPVIPPILPGYLRTALPEEAPEKGENFDAIMSDVNKFIMPGVTHWQSPRFHAYFPSGSSFPSLLGGLLSDAIGAIGFSWISNPAGTELEVVVLNWLGKMIGLPNDFLMLNNESMGGGVIQGSASECVLVSLLAARNEALCRLRKLNPGVEDGVLLGRLVCYCSKEAHSCVEKAAMIGFVKIRFIDVDFQFRLRNVQLKRVIKADRDNGLYPFFCSATLGTTSCCSFDCLEEIGKVCKEENMWFHVDAAYAGCAFICPEFRNYLNGVEYADSINTNCNKFLLVNFDCSVMWLKDRHKLTKSMVVNPVYLQNRGSDREIDYRHWQIPLSRRFRALKLWFVIRNYGVDGLQKYIRNHVKLAKYFAQILCKDTRLKICNEVILGLVCFRIKGSNKLTEVLLESITQARTLFMIPAMLKDDFVIRFCICAENATAADVLYAVNQIIETTDRIFELRVKRPMRINEDDIEEEISRPTPEKKKTFRPFFNRLFSDSDFLSCPTTQPGDKCRQLSFGETIL